MGRPLYKDVRGADARGDYTTGSVGIRVTAFFGGSSRNDCFILKQTGARRYKVQDKSDSTVSLCKLVATAPAANGEMQLMGYPGGNGQNGIAIKSLKKRTATGWNGLRYTWYLSNDSSNDYIVLKAV